MKILDFAKSKKELLSELMPLLRKCRIADDEPIKIHLNLKTLYEREKFYDLIWTFFPEWNGLLINVELRKLTYLQLVEELNKRAE